MQIFGRDKEELSTLHWQRLLPDDHEHCRKAVFRLSRSSPPGAVTRMRVAVRRPDGTSCQVRISLSIADIPGQSARCILCVMDDAGKHVAKVTGIEQGAGSLAEVFARNVSRLQENAPATRQAPLPAAAAAEGSAELVADDPRLSPANDPEWIDLGVLAHRVSNKPGDVRRLALKFIESAMTVMPEIEAALCSKDAASLASLAHRIKAPARTVGAERFAQSCQRLEGVGSGEPDWEQTGLLVASLRALLEEIRRRVDRCLQNFSSMPTNTAESGLPVHPVASLCVLMVDDESFHFEFVGNILHNFGIHDIHHARDGVEGLALYRSLEKRPDVLICDLNMPRMDGVEFLRHIAGLQYRGGVILLSGAQGAVLKTVAELMREHGLDLLGVFEKPASPDALSSALSKVGRLKRNPVGISSPIEALTVEELREGLSDDRIEVYFQPKIDIGTGVVVGAECLARWRHPVHGIIGPSTFIPVAEEHGLIDEVTLAILRKSVFQLGQWQKEGHCLALSVNVSMDNLRHLKLPETFGQILSDAGVSPGDVVLELTESRLMDDQATSLDVIARLRLKGFGLSIDDFGTGFSTLDSLKRLPFTELKVDRAFVHGVANDPLAHVILSSSVHLARTFQLKVVAEGVETREDWDVVAKAGCDTVQGYFVARPMPAGEFIFWKARRENDEAGLRN